MTPIPGLRCLPIEHLAQMTPRQRDDYAALLYRKGRASAQIVDSEAERLEEVIRDLRKQNSSLAGRLGRVSQDVTRLEDQLAAEGCCCRPGVKSEDPVISERQAVLESMSGTRKASA